MPQAAPRLTGLRSGTNTPVPSVQVGPGTLRQVWVANVNTGINTINIYTPDGAYVRQLSGNGLGSPGGITVINGVVWVPNIRSGSNSISLFRLDGTALGTITGNSLNAPQNVTQVENVVWAANSAASTMSVFSLSGAPVATFAAGAAGRDFAAAGGVVFFAPSGGGALSAYGTDYSLLQSGIGTFGQQRFLSHAPIAGLIWVPGGSGVPSINLLDPLGRKQVRTITISALTAPYGVAQVGPYVWLADGNSNTIYILTTTGSVVRTLTGNGLNTPEAICPIYY